MMKIVRVNSKLEFVWLFLNLKRESSKLNNRKSYEWGLNGKLHYLIRDSRKKT